MSHSIYRYAVKNATRYGRIHVNATTRPALAIGPFFLAFCIEAEVPRVIRIENPASVLSSRFLSRWAAHFGAGFRCSEYRSISRVSDGKRTREGLLPEKLDTPDLYSSARFEK